VSQYNRVFLYTGILWNELLTDAGSTEVL